MPAFPVSYHNHTRYCDGQGSVDQVVEAAAAAGLVEVGISSHAPLPFATEWTMPLDALDSYVNDVRQTQKRYADRIQVLLGAEIDFIPGPAITAFQQERILSNGFDYFVVSVHFLGHIDRPRSMDDSRRQFDEILAEDYAGDLRAMVADYYGRVARSVTIPRGAIIGHLDRIKRWNHGRRYFTGEEPWYRGAVNQALDTIEASGAIVELNTSGWDKGLEEPFPSEWILACCGERGIPITISSDSHSPADLTRHFDRARDLLSRHRIEPVYLRPQSPNENRP